jgi:hypothetical protein
MFIILHKNKFRYIYNKKTYLHLLKLISCFRADSIYDQSLFQLKNAYYMLKSLRNKAYVNIIDMITIGLYIEK